MKRILLVALFFLSLVASAQADVPTDRLAILAKGVNLTTVFSGVPLLKIDAELQQISHAGLQHIRIFVDPAWVLRHKGVRKSRLRQVVSAAVADHLGVILCMDSATHQMNDQATPAVIRQWVEAWQSLAHRYATGFPSGMVFFELANEPTMAAKRWNVVQDTLLQAVRRVAPRNTILLAGSPYSTAWALDTLVPSKDDDVAYVIHLYQPMVFTHQGAQWDPRYTAIKHLRYLPDANNIRSVANHVPPAVAKELADYGKSGAAAMARDLAFAKQLAETRHLHIVVTEFGVYRTAPPASRARWLDQARHIMEEDGFGWTVWDFGAGFGIKPDLVGCTAVVRALGLHCVP